MTSTIDARRHKPGLGLRDVFAGGASTPRPPLPFQELPLCVVMSAHRNARRGQTSIRRESTVKTERVREGDLPHERLLDITIDIILGVKATGDVLFESILLKYSRLNDCNFSN